MPDEPVKKKGNGRAATIAAIGGLIVALGTAGTQVYKAVTADDDKDRAKAGTTLQVQRAYLRLREANVRMNERMNAMAQTLNQVQGQVQVLTSICTQPPPSHHAPAHHAAVLFGSETTVHVATPEEAYKVVEQSIVDEMDMLEELPDEVPAPEETEVDEYLNGRE